MWRICASAVLPALVWLTAGAAPASFAPAPGSYYLPVIQAGPAGTVLAGDGRSVPLAPYLHGRVTLLNFMYTYCTDPVGCPLLFSTLHTVRARLLATPALARKVRFVSISFDPSNDTPEIMQRYGGPLAGSANLLHWDFLTTRSVDDLRPVLASLDQPVQVQRDKPGGAGRLYYHLLKLYLFDRNGNIREIYSAAFLQPEIIYNDIRTLLMETEPGRAAHAPGKAGTK